MGKLNSNVFYPRLNDFCRKYFVQGANPTRQEIQNIAPALRQVQEDIFENFLLFDKVSFKVFGENIPLTLLLRFFEIKRLEELIEQEAIDFILWTPTILTLVDNIKGVNPIASGVHNSGPHCDPEQSLELGFNWMQQPPKRSVRRSLVRKLRDVYRLPDHSLPHDAAAFITSGFHGGKLSAYGLDPKEKEYDSLTSIDKKTLALCAEDLLEYSFILANQMTSISKGEYFNFFCESKRKISLATDTSTAFNEICRIEDFPDLKALFSQIENPFQKIVSLRNKRASVKFRKWLHEYTDNEFNIHPITHDYIQAIVSPRGFFQTWKGKFTKTIVTSSIGAALGGGVGAAVGATAAHFADPMIDLVDDYLLDGLTKGWTPRLFVDELRNLETK